MRLILEVMRHHRWWLWRRARFWPWIISQVLVIVIIVSIFLAHEVFRAFVLMCAAILSIIVSIDSD
jgi:hypothetical protein